MNKEELTFFKKIDSELSELRERIAFFSQINPLNRSEEKTKFFNALRRREKYNPRYQYHKKDLSKEIHRLYSLIDPLNNSGTLGELLVTHISFLLKLCRLALANDEQFGEISCEIYGSPPEDHYAQAMGILTKKEEVFTDEIILPEDVARDLNARMKEYDVNWRVEVSEDIVPKVSISGKKKAVFINARMSFTPEEVQRLRIHEIDVHVLRGLNGSMQPLKIFCEGTPGYDKTEEGLAVYIEKAAGCLEKDRRQLYLYAGRTVAVYHALKKSFYETYTILREMIPEPIAYRLTERVKRGLRNTALPGAYTKDYFYISGYNTIVNYVREGGDLKELYFGKIGIGDIPLVKELLKEGFLYPPKVLPEVLNVYN